MPRRAAFTLLELCLAMLIAVIITSMAIPSLSGIVEDRQRHATFDEFDSLVREIQARAISERRSYSLQWEKRAIVARPSNPKNKEEKGGVARMDFDKGAECAVFFPASLIKDPGPVWTFWPTGTCEPAHILFKGPKGSWMADYDPLTLRADVTTNVPR